MRRNFLTRLRINGTYYMVAALLLLVGVPLYQWLLLLPGGYSNALAAASAGRFPLYLLWLHQHLWSFAGYRLLQIAAFALLLSLPFTLFRIIVAQEILGRDDEPASAQPGSEEQHAEDGHVQRHEGENEEEGESNQQLPATAEEMLAIPWRGKGFAVIAAWSGLLALLLSVLGNLAGTIYLVVVARGFSSGALPPSGFSWLTGLFTIVAYTAGDLLLALTTLFFGIIIARSGLKLWPPSWVAFGYLAILLAAFFSGSAVEVAMAPAGGQALLTTPALLLFAIWAGWMGFMLVRLRPAPA
jgi:hypothetical protein